MKRTIEINDNLQEWVDGAIADVKEALLDFLNDNPDTDETPDWGNDLDYSGRLHEIIDGAVPIYTADIDAAFYLHGDEIEQAFDDAGIGSKDDKGWPMGWKPAAIYCYIEQQAQEWFRNNADDLFQAWKEKQPKV